MTLLSPLLILLGAFCVAGCSAEIILHPSSESHGTALTSNAALSRPAQTPIGLAFLPAEAGPVLAVRESQYANGVHQEIVLGGKHLAGGENAIVVAALKAPAADFKGARDDLLRIDKPTLAAIADELTTRFPGMDMSVSPVTEANPQGVFGFATGQTGGTACIYAWQFIEPDRPMTLVEGATSTGTYPLSVRVHLCRDLPVSQLLGFARQLVLRPLDAAIPALALSTSIGGGDALDVALGRQPLLDAVHDDVPLLDRTQFSLEKPAPRRARYLRPLRQNGPGHAGRTQVVRGKPEGVPTIPLPDTLASPARAILTQVGPSEGK